MCGSAGKRSESCGRGKHDLPPRWCSECLHFERPAVGSPEHGRSGKCALARKRFGGEVTMLWTAPACKGFEAKEKKDRYGRKR